MMMTKTTLTTTNNSPLPFVIIALPFQLAPEARMNMRCFDFGGSAELGIHTIQTNCKRKINDGLA
jgi:hypothetical protein